MDVQGIIANNLKTLRKSSGFTQQEIADLISTDISVYSRIESGKTMISHDKLFQLSKIYRVPIEKFYEGLGSNIQNNYDNAQVTSNVQINMSSGLEQMQTDVKIIKELLIQLISNNKK
jgi:transcriptional regulator with XRE-family HTH domain